MPASEHVVLFPKLPPDPQFHAEFRNLMAVVDSLPEHIADLDSPKMLAHVRFAILLRMLEEKMPGEDLSFLQDIEGREFGKADGKPGAPFKPEMKDFRTAVEAVRLALEASYRKEGAPKAPMLAKEALVLILTNAGLEGGITAFGTRRQRLTWIDNNSKALERTPEYLNGMVTTAQQVAKRVQELAAVTPNGGPAAIILTATAALKPRIAQLKAAGEL